MQLVKSNGPRCIGRRWQRKMAKDLVKSKCGGAASVAGMHPYWMHTNTKYAPCQCTLKDASIIHLMDHQKAPTTGNRTSNIKK